MRLIAKHEGDGQLVIAGQDPISVRYYLEEYQEDIPAKNLANPNATAPGLRRLIGRIGTGRHGVALVGGPHTLCLEDGRRLAVLVTRADAAGADIRATGAFF